MPLSEETIRRFVERNTNVSVGMIHEIDGTDATFHF
jgi:hypothetical protein